MEIMKYFLALLFLMPELCWATPVTFQWDPVTTNTDGSPAGAVIYHLYYKSKTGPYLLLASKIFPTYTWDVPQIGDWTFTVRALSKLGESDNSNEVEINVDPCWTEITPGG